MYKRHKNCECISIGEFPTCCIDFTSDHPESQYRGPFKPKLLTWAHESLDTNLDGMDFMSADINDERAPKGLTCPTITAIPEDEPSLESCPLCDSSCTLEIIQDRQAKGQSLSANAAGTSAGKQAENSLDEATAADGPVGRRENSLEEYQVRRRAERPQGISRDEPTSTLETRSNDRPTSIQSQTPATISAIHRIGLAESRGHRRTDSMSSDSPHYLDP